MMKRVAFALIAAAALAGPAYTLKLNGSAKSGDRPGQGAWPIPANREIEINSADRTLFYRAPDGSLGLGAMLNALPSGRRAVERGQADDLTALATGASVRASLAEIAARRRWWRDYGLVCDGTTAEGPAIQAALNMVAGLGGGTFDIADRRCFAGASDIKIPSNVTVSGNRPFAGGYLRDGAFSTLPSALVFSPGYGVKTSPRSGLGNLAVTTNALQQPGGIGQAMQVVAAWANAGTGITVGSPESGNHSDNTVLKNVFVMGFNRCIDTTHSAQLTFSNVFGDCLNGMRVNKSHDISRFDHVEFWPYFTTAQTFTTTARTISNATNNGAGLVRLTVNSTSDLVSGIIGHVQGVGGVPGANNRFTVTVVNATTIDLQGSTWSGSYTGGGKIQFLANKRYGGRGFEFTNLEVAYCYDCFGYGFDVGFDVADGVDDLTLVAGTIDDAFALRDANTIGVRVRGTARRFSMIGGFVGPVGTPFVIDTASNTEPALFSGVTLNAVNASSGRVLRGSVQLSGGTRLGGSLPLYVADAAGTVTLSGSTLGNVPFEYQSPANARKVVMSGVPGRVTTSQGDFQLQANGLGYSWIDTEGGRPRQMVGADNNMVLYGTKADGTELPIWSVGMRTDAPTLSLIIPTEFTRPLTVRAAQSQGYTTLHQGEANRTGYLAFSGADGTRHGYVGYSNGTVIPLVAEVGTFDFNKAPTIAGGTVWHAGNSTPNIVSAAADPTAANITAGRCVDWSNTTANTLKRVCNVGGALKSITYQ